MVKIHLSKIHFRPYSEGEIPTDFGNSSYSPPVRFIDLTTIKFRPYQEPDLTSGTSGGGGSGFIFPVESDLSSAGGSLQGDNSSVVGIPAAIGSALGYGSTSSTPSLGYGGGQPLFYRFIAPSDGTLTVQTSAGVSGTPIGDSIIVIFTDPALTSNTVVAANDDFSGLYSKKILSVSSGVTYYIAVDGYNPGAGWDADLIRTTEWLPDEAYNGTFTLTWSFI